MGLGIASRIKRPVCFCALQPRHGKGVVPRPRRPGVCTHGLDWKGRDPGYESSGSHRKQSSCECERSLGVGASALPPQLGWIGARSPDYYRGGGLRSPPPPKKTPTKEGPRFFSLQKLRETSRRGAAWRLRGAGLFSPFQGAR